MSEIFAVVALSVAAVLFDKMVSEPKLRRAAAVKARRAIEVAASLQSAATGDYLRASQLESWMREHPGFRKLGLSRRESSRLAHAPEFEAAWEPVAGLFEDPYTWTAARNERYLAARLQELESWFTTRFANPLTEQQRRAMLTDEDCNLVVAGAGAGKTATILAKLAYLIEQRGVDPSEILVLAFNRTVATELEDRIAGMGIPLPEVSTFQ